MENYNPALIEWLETICPDCQEKYGTSYTNFNAGGKRSQYQHRCIGYKTKEPRP